MTSADSGDESAEWAAEKREFVADSRDDAADDREALGGTRDALADTREAQLGVWEKRLEARARALGLVGAGSSPAAEPAETSDARVDAAQERAAAARARDQATVLRDAATERRSPEGSTTLLAVAFAGIAEVLYAAETYDEVLTRIAEAAVTTVAGSTMASVTLPEGDSFRTAATTDAAAAAVDQAQYKAGEGPSLDAITVPLVDAPEFPDERWPTLASGPVDHGVQSSVSYHLDTAGREAAEAGAASLTIYGSDPAAFDETAREIGFILAAHASLAARAVGERMTLEGLGGQLQQALLSRDVIGQAKGILMERHKTTPEDAFEILKRASQQLNVKLREVALRLTETGEIDPGDLRGR